MCASLANMDNLQIWNAARKLSTQLLGILKESNEDIENGFLLDLDGENNSSDKPDSLLVLRDLRLEYYSLADESDVWPFTGFEHYLTEIDQLGPSRVHSDYKALHKELSNVISSRLQAIKKGEYHPDKTPQRKAISQLVGLGDGELDDDTDVDTDVGEGEDQSVEALVDRLDIEDPEIASLSADLYQCFVVREGVTYTDIKSEYGDVPPRSMLLTTVINSTGESKTERIHDIAEWVDEWYDDPERLSELSKRSPRLMGSVIRS